jgi:hypothetical protein
VEAYRIPFRVKPTCISYETQYLLTLVLARHPSKSNAAILDEA